MIGTAPKTALSLGRRTARYIGWTGHGNLGDEAIFGAVSAMFRRTLSLQAGDIPDAQAVVLGGGTLIDGADEYEAPFRASSARLKFVFGTGVEAPLFARRSDYLSRWVHLLNDQASGIFVRTDESRQWLVDNGLKRPITTCGDPIFYWAAPFPPPGPLTGTIGVNVGHSFDRVWGGSDAAALAALKTGLRPLGKSGFRFLFFPAWYDDLPICVRLAEELSKEGFSAGCAAVLRPERFRSLAASVDVFIGQKLHAVALAASSGVPVVMCEYRPKCGELMRSLRLGEFVIRGDRLTPDALGFAVRTAIDRRSDIRETLEDRVLAQRTAVLEAADAVNRMVEAGDA